MRTSLPILIVIAVATAAFVYAQGSTGTVEPAKVGGPAPVFAIKDVYGKVFKLSDFKGKYVVLEWISKECPVSRACHSEQTKRIMQETYKKYASKGVVWLAIDSSHFAKPEPNRVYAAEAGLAYPILHDPDGKVGRSYGAAHTPHMFVIDKNGKLAYRGAIDDRGSKNYVAAALDDLLAGRPVGTPETRAYGCSVKYAAGK